MTPSTLRSLQIGGLFLITLLACAFAQAQLRPGDVALESVQLAGTGCPAGSARAELSPDGTALTILYDRFQAQVGRTVHTARANCQVLVRIRKPQLYSFAVESADFRGFVALERGARAEQRVRIETGSDALARINVNIGAQSWLGPLNQNFTVSAARPVEGLKYLSCLQPQRSAQLNVMSTITLENGRSNAEGLIAVDSFDGSLVQRYRLRWMNCVQVGAGIIGGIIRAIDQHR